MEVCCTCMKKFHCTVELPSFSGRKGEVLGLGLSLNMLETHRQECDAAD